MANISRIKLPNNFIYDIKDNNAAPLDSPILTGNPTAPTPSIDDTSKKIATTEFVENKIISMFSINKAMIYKGIIDNSGDSNKSLPNEHEAGWTYKVGEIGTYAGKECKVGDIIICIKSGSIENNNDWEIINDSNNYISSDYYNINEDIVTENLIISLNKNITIKESNNSNTLEEIHFFAGYPVDNIKYITFIGDGTTTNFKINTSTVNWVSIDSTLTYNYHIDSNFIIFDSPPTQNSLITIQYPNSTNNRLKNYYTLGERTNLGAIGTGSVAEGKEITAGGNYSHAEGLETIAIGIDSHAEGWYSKAIGQSSHAEGYDTIAKGINSHTEGSGTEAIGENQHVFGSYNIPDLNKIEIVGNGTYLSKSNARTLDWNGNEFIAGALSVGDVSTTKANLGIIDAPIIITTINSVKSDTLLCNDSDAEKISLLQSGQLVFIILAKATIGENNIIITNGNDISKDIYLNFNTPLCINFNQGNILGLIYINNNLYMINTPNFATGVSF